MYSLDTYINKFIPKDMPINYLSVDVEGWDYNVLMGGQQHALERVPYLDDGLRYVFLYVRCMRWVYIIIMCLVVVHVRRRG